MRISRTISTNNRQWRNMRQVQSPKRPLAPTKPVESSQAQHTVGLVHVGGEISVLERHIGLSKARSLEGISRQDGQRGPVNYLYTRSELHNEKSEGFTYPEITPRASLELDLVVLWEVGEVLHLEAVAVPHLRALRALVRAMTRRAGAEDARVGVGRVIDDDL